MTRPFILGHRGASATAPENTISAFLRARELGADGVELDVRLSRDHVPVVIHDRTVDRTTNGNGAVEKLTVLELKHLDAGSWKSESYRGESIPLLAEVLDALKEWLKPVGPARSPRGIVNIEMKSGRLRTDGLEREVLNLLAQKNLEGRVLVSSFDPLVLWRVRQLNPTVKRGLIFSPSEPIWLRRAWLRVLAAPHALHPEHEMINPPLIQWADRRKIDVIAWTVNEPAEAKRLATIGAAGIITNEPDVICRAVA